VRGRFFLKDVKRHGQYLGYPRNYEVALTDAEKKDIYTIVTFLADQSLLSIAAHRSELEATGDRIDAIHPLNFLATVFTNEELKVGIRNIRKKGWIWGDFIGGIKEALATESKINNLREDQIKDFCKRVKIDPRVLFAPYKNKNWDELIDTLIKKVPRAGQYDRYDSKLRVWREV
jgi:hypothetical protein